MSKDCADLMIEIARLARELGETRRVVSMLREDVEGLRHELGKPNYTTAEQMALALEGERDEKRSDSGRR